MARKVSKNRKFDMKKDSATGLYRIRALRDIGSIGGGFVEAGTYGGLISHKEVLSNSGACWIEYGCTVINSIIKDDAYIGGNSIVENSTVDKRARVLQNSTVRDSIITENAQIHNNATIINHCVIKGMAIVAGNSFLSHYVMLSGKVTCRDDTRIIGGITIDKPVILTKDLLHHIEQRMLAKFGKPIDNKYYVCYKVVKSTGKDKVFLSCYNPEFIYDLHKTNTTIIEKQYNKRKKVLCAEGLHAAMSEDYDWSATYQNDADTILTCRVNVEDIIAIDETMGSKIRCRKLTVVDIRKYPLDKELAQLKVVHNLNSSNMITTIYNNKTFEVFNDYKVIPYDKKTTIFKLNIDQDNDSANNYNTVILSALPANATPVLPPKVYRELIIGTNIDDVFNITHNLKTKHLITIIYDLHDKHVDVHKQCKIKYIDDNNLTVRFDHVLKSKEEYKVIVVAPNRPLTIGSMSSRGIANATPFSSISVFMGSNVDPVDNSIIIAHPYNKMDVFGSLLNNDLNETWPMHLTRIDDSKVQVTLEKKPNRNHQFVLMITKV